MVGRSTRTELLSYWNGYGRLHTKHHEVMNDWSVRAVGSIKDHILLCWQSFCITAGLLESGLGGCSRDDLIMDSNLGALVEDIGFKGIIV